MKMKAPQGFPHFRYYVMDVVFLFLFLCSSTFFCGGGGVVVLSSTIPPFHQGISLGLSMGRIAVIGAINADITVRVSTLPTPGETVTSLSPRTSMAVGGKGANQAVAAARMAAEGYPSPSFAARFGADAQGRELRDAIAAEGVDVSRCASVEGMTSGQGLVFLQESGEVGSVVVGGANSAWPDDVDDNSQFYEGLVEGAAVVMLQREIPEHVNEHVAHAAKKAGAIVIQDVGGEDRPFSRSLLQNVDYLCPNESELARLSGGASTATDQDVLAAARALQERGANAVVVTLGERGSVLVPRPGSEQESAPIFQPPVAVPGGVVRDVTGAGDSFRAAFAVALAERRPLEECLKLASAAGAVAVSRLGAVPSLPTRAEAEALLDEKLSPTPPAPSCSEREISNAGRREKSEPSFPLLFGSRLNSMRSRRDLVDDSVSNDVLGWVARQGEVRGLDLVDFNYPQHLRGLATEDVLGALARAGLRAGAVCMRFPEEHFRQGAFSNPSEVVRTAAVQLTAEGCEWAKRLGTDEVVVWPQFDGYDYHLQANYTEAEARMVNAYRAASDACVGVKLSLEFKPTDEAARFSFVPSTGAALLLAERVGRDNFGLTLDFGHLLAAGENPAQSLAMVAGAGKLFGLQIGDGHSRLGAEDGLAFGSVHGAAALELVFWLRTTGYEGHVYFDTFPRNEDPVREAEHNIRRFKALWDRAVQLERNSEVRGALLEYDAMTTLEVLETNA